MAKSNKRYHFLLVLVIQVLVFASCTVVKNYPPKPFVYETDIKLHGDLNTNERKDLLSKLEMQLDDSVRARRVQKFIGWEGVPMMFYTTINNPPVFDSLNADMSVLYMRALLNSLGYYRDTISYDTSLNIVKGKEGPQYRTNLTFNVTPGRVTRLDSIRYNIEHDTLQQITVDAMNESLLKKGEPFAKALLSTELDRLSDVYRNNGYLRFSREELIIVWDTVGIDLLRPTLDPLEQLRQLELLRQRRLNPVADIEVRLRANEDTSHLTRYYVGDVTVYPDLSSDTAVMIPTVSTYNDYQIVSFEDMYKHKVLAENIYMQRGELYRQRNYLKTLNRFNSIGSWRLVSIDQIPRAYTDTVDFVIRLTPAPKYEFNANIEGSQNWGNVFTQGNLIGLNLRLQNRNFARGANLANTNLRYGVEIAPERLRSQELFAQSTQFSLGHTIRYPRAILPKFKFITPEQRENIRTVFAFNTSYTSRLDFFNFTAFNSSWGYEYNWKNKFITFRFPNIEYGVLDVGPILQTLIDQNQSYQYIFNGGLVSSSMASLTITGGKKNIAHSIRINGEASGLISGLVPSKFLEENLQRFVKADAEFRQNHKIRRSAFAWRVFAGFGYQLPSDRFLYNRNLPFYKSFIAGGANSMRAWTLRRLGPGSTIRSFARDSFPDRFGDMQLELNAEYRFYLTEISGVQINSAIFTDIGNIWLLRKNDIYPDGEFRFNKIGRDLAIGLGTGIRIDFGLFLIRVDYAYKVKDPSPGWEHRESQNKWFHNWKWTGGQIQIGVTYPF